MAGSRRSTRRHDRLATRLKAVATAIDRRSRIRRGTDRALLELARQDGDSITELASRLGVSVSEAGRVTRRLEEYHWVKRRREGTRLRVFITPSGRQYSRMYGGVPYDLAKRLASLENSELHVLEAAADILHRALELPRS